MSLKLMIADDSLTIQKVIKIALLNEDFDISICPTSDDLLKNISEEQPKIVLLDYNLSEEKDGLELAKDILDDFPHIQILMLYRTFDNIDDDALNSIGVANKIIKPFDGNEFINKCRAMRSHFESEEPNESIQVEEAEEFHVEEESSEWVMNIPDKIEEKSHTFNETSSNDSDKLEQDLADWGMSIPGVIGQESDSVEIPDIIGSATKSNDSQVKYPSSEDLEYPDDINEIATSSQLIPLDDLEEDEIAVEDDEKTTEFELNSNEDSGEIHVKDIEAQILDDSDEDEDLWAADEEVSVSEDELPLVEPHKLHEVMKNTPELKHLVTDNKDIPSDFPKDVMEEDLQVSKIDLTEQIKKDITPIIEAYVQKYCSEYIEKIAWEVIPDLAENVIKQEIRRISENVINSEV